MTSSRPERSRWRDVAWCWCLAFATTAIAQNDTPAPKSSEAPTYQAVPAVPSDQVQVIFFRKAGESHEPAHVYIDGKFHSALMPRNFTRLCVRPGAHSIEAYVGDAPTYAGKSKPATQVKLEGGRTYFVAVSDQGMGEPEPFRRVDAERLLEGAREQRRFLSRASSVIPCTEAIPNPPQSNAPDLRTQAMTQDAE